MWLGCSSGGKKSRSGLLQDKEKHSTHAIQPPPYVTHLILIISRILNHIEHLYAHIHTYIYYNYFSNKKNKTALLMLSLSLVLYLSQHEREIQNFQRTQCQTPKGYLPFLLINLFLITHVSVSVYVSHTQFFIFLLFVLLFADEYLTLIRLK